MAKASSFSKKGKSDSKIATYAFLDATNIIYGASDSGWKMDFKKLSRYLKERYDAEKILYYAGVDAENKKQLRFYEKLQEFGYLLRLIPVKTFKDGRKKADVDSRMTFEMMLYFDKYDRALVMTGDGDYYWVLEYLLLKHKSVKLLAHASSTARDLKKMFEGNFQDLNDVKNRLRRQKNEVDPTDVSTSQDYDESIPKKKQFVKRKK